MKALFLELRIAVCETLLGLILMIVPEEHEDGPRLIAAVDSYCRATLGLEETDI